MEDRMKIVSSILVVGLGLAIGLPAAAQNIGVLESAETVDKGVFKLTLAPVMNFGEDGADDEFGLSVRAGYGFTDRFDAEAKLGLSDLGTYVGADGEFWIVKGPERNRGIDVSLAGGLHWVFGSNDNFDTMGFDLRPLLSGHVGEPVELYGALDASFESIDDAPAGFDDSYTRLHLVPGIEYSVSPVVDLLGEVGIALNDESSSYAGIGLAFYLR
jgi:hypothetical protein